MRKFVYCYSILLLLMHNAYADLNIALLPPTTTKTPHYIGINLGHYLPGSNTSLYLRHLGVNTVRVWLDGLGGHDLKKFIGPDWGKNLSCQRVSTQSAFLTAVSELRKISDPATYSVNGCTNYRYQNMANNFAQKLTPTTDNRRVQTYILSEMKKLDDILPNGLKTLANVDKVFMSITLSASGTSLGWQDRWEFYKAFYLHAYYLGLQNVRRFELVNERDELWTQNEFIERYEIASLAIQNAFSDHFTLSPEIMAPATVSDRFTTNPAAMNSAVKYRQIQFPNTTPNSDWSNLTAYSWHKYAGECNVPAAQSYSKATTTIRNELNSNGADALTIWLTEFNSHYAAQLDKLTQTTMDSVDEASLFAQKAASMVNNATAKGIYTFKFSQTSVSGDAGANSGVKKNGIHWVDNSDPALPGVTDNIGGTTRAAESLALLAPHFAGSRFKLAMTGSSTNACMPTMAIEHEGHYDFFAVNNTSMSMPLHLNLSGLLILNNSVAVIHKVSTKLHGEVEATPLVNSSTILNVTLDAYSTTLITFEKQTSRPAASIALLPTDDAYVSAGSKSSSNTGTQTTLGVSTSSSSVQSLTRAAYLKFQLPSLTQRLYKGILELYIKTSGTRDTILHIYGLSAKASAAWSENTLTWSNAPQLKPLENGVLINEIKKNFFHYSDPVFGDAVFISSMRVSANSQGIFKMIDVTDFIKTNPFPTFLILREYRFNAYGNAIQYPGDNFVGSTVIFSSKEDAVNKPTLRLYLD